jgi:hypothetical protein
VFRIARNAATVAIECRARRHDRPRIARRARAGGGGETAGAQGDGTAGARGRAGSRGGGAAGARGEAGAAGFLNPETDDKVWALAV